MPTPYIDPSLGVLRTQLRAQYPGVVIYWIGDSSHSTRKSDHNPETDGSVDAIDIMIGAKFTKAQADELVNTLTHYKDGRISYIIWWRRIWHKVNGVWKWDVYNGSDPHTNHIHISRNDVNEASTAQWRITIPKKVAAVIVVKGSWPVLQEGDKDTDFDGYDVIRRLQKIHQIKVDGWWGKETTKAFGVKKTTEKFYRQAFGLTVVKEN